MTLLVILLSALTLIGEGVIGGMILLSSDLRPDLLLTLKARAGVTILHVTHDAGEAARLADRLLLMQDGKVTTV